MKKNNSKKECPHLNENEATMLINTHFAWTQENLLNKNQKGKSLYEVVLYNWNGPTKIIHNHFTYCK